MRRTSLLVLLAAAALAPAALAAGRTSLTVSYFPYGLASASHPTVWHLTCAPAAGTHPAARTACLELARTRTAAELGPARRPCVFLVPPRAPYAWVRGLYNGV